MIVAIILLFVFVFLQCIFIWKLYKRPYIDISRDEREVIIKSMGHELTRFLKLEKNEK